AGRSVRHRVVIGARDGGDLADRAGKERFVARGEVAWQKDLLARVKADRLRELEDSGARDPRQHAAGERRRAERRTAHEKEIAGRRFRQVAGRIEEQRVVGANSLRRPAAVRTRTARAANGSPGGSACTVRTVVGSAAAGARPRGPTPRLSVRRNAASAQPRRRSASVAAAMVSARCSGTAMPSTEAPAASRSRWRSRRNTVPSYARIVSN